MFIIGFLGKFSQNFWSFLRNSLSDSMISYQIVKKRLSDSFAKHIPHPSIIFSVRSCNPWPGSLPIPSYQIPIPVPFFFILTPFASFIFKSTITITDPAHLRQFWVVFWAIYHKFFHQFFFSTFITGMILMIINNLPRICNFAAIFPDPQVLICWLQGPPFFCLIFFKLHSLHDFASLTSLFLFILLNSDSSLRALHMVHTWGIHLYACRPRQGSNFVDRTQVRHNVF